MWAYWLLYAVLVVAANGLAQLILPTVVTDPYDRRVVYRFIFIGSLIACGGVFAAMGDLMETFSASWLWLAGVGVLAVLGVVGWLFRYRLVDGLRALEAWRRQPPKN